MRQWNTFPAAFFHNHRLIPASALQNPQSMRISLWIPVYVLFWVIDSKLCQIVSHKHAAWEGGGGV